MSCNAKKISLPKINTLLSILRAKKYIVYKKPYQINIIGVRNKISNPEKFDDYIYVIYKNENFNWQGFRFNATTDPSTKYLKSSSSKGIAILPQGQYVNSFKLRLHNGQYLALGQSKDICVYRDYDRNNTLNFDINTKTCGLFGINIHRAKSNSADDGNGNTEYIGDYSAGCQVFQNYYCFQQFIDLLEQSKSLYGNSFTYTLIDKSLQRKFIFKRLIFGSSLIVGFILIGLGIKKIK